MNFPDLPIKELTADLGLTGHASCTVRLCELYAIMVRIRRCEEAVAELVESGEARTPCHLYIGQEAVATGVCAALQHQDSVWGGHRSHGHFLAKGGDLRSMMAEILGKATGCSGGRGGSMHLVAPEIGIMGTVPIVAATVPLAVGAALASKRRGDGAVAVAFFGDGTLEEGHVHESMNIAALYTLPIVFVCENNLYASHMHLSLRRVRNSLCEAGEFHGVPGYSEDGNDVSAVYRVAENAVGRARAGQGPTFLEFRTFRWRGHVGPSWDMDVGVKRSDELKDWLPRDPIQRARGELRRLGISSEALDSVDEAIACEVQTAIQFAKASPRPLPSEVAKHVFSS